MKHITKKSISLILIIMTLMSMLTIIPITTEAATAYKTLNLTHGQVDTITCNFTAGSYFGFCIDAAKATPGENSSATFYAKYLATNKANSSYLKMLRKILYYGYKGPGSNMYIKKDGKNIPASSWLNSNVSTSNSSRNITHLALSYWYNNQTHDRMTYSYRYYIQEFLDTLNTFPEAPPVDIYVYEPSYGQRILISEFHVKVAAVKLSSQGSNGITPTMNNIIYTVTDEGDKWKGDITINNPANGYQNTQWGAYGWSNASKHSEPTATINDTVHKWACHGKDSGQILTQTGKMTLREKQTNKAYVKNETVYTMQYFTRDTQGYGVLIPTNGVTGTDYTLPVDVPNGVYQIKKTSSAPNQGVQITGAIYAIFTNKNDADAANSKTYESAEAAKKAAPDSWIKVDADGYGRWGDSINNGVNSHDTDPIYKNKNSGRERPIPTEKKYYAREIWAPSGYAIDKTTYEFKYSGKVDSNGVPIFRTEATSTDVLNIKLQTAKISSKPNITDGNAAYSYEGAEFTVYYKDGNEYKEFKPEGSVIKLTSDEDSYAKYGTDPQGATNNKASDYAPFKNKNSGKPIPIEKDVELYIKETKAPKGYVATDTYYKLVRQNLTDSKEYYIYRASDKTAVDQNEAAGTNTQKITNAPEFDPWGLKLTKQASSGTSNMPLSGAIFRISYYDYVPTSNNNIDQKDGQNIPIKTELQNSKTKVKRIWYIETKEDDENTFTAILNENHLVTSGAYKTTDALYYDDDNRVIIPMGLITVEEVKAPEGFKIKDWTWYIGVTHTQIEDVTAENEPIKLTIDEDASQGYIGVKKKNEAGNRVAGAKYGLYETENDANNNTNKIAELTTTLTSNVPDKNDGDIFLASGQPYKAVVGKTYYIRETEVPPATSTIIYLLDNHTYRVTPTENNATVESAIMIDSTDFTEDTPKGSIKVKKTSDDNKVENIYFALIDNRGHEYEAKSVNEDGYAQWDNLQIYERGNSGAKIEYTIKELGYSVTFQTGKNTYTNTQGEYTWSIAKNDCIEYPQRSKQYFEGVANPIYQTTWKTEKLYPKWYYRNQTEAQTNQNGKTTTLNDPNATTEVKMLEFHNGIPRIKLKIEKTGAQDRNDWCRFQVKDSTDKIYSQIGNLYGVDGILQPDVEYSQVFEDPGFMISCQPYPNSAIPLPMTYTATEVGWQIPVGISPLYTFGDAWYEPIMSEAQTTDVTEDEKLLTFTCINQFSTYNFDITKVSEDDKIANLWFEITGIMTDIPIDTYKTNEPWTKDTFKNNPELWDEAINKFGDGTYENPHVDYVIGPNDELYPIIAWSKDGNEMKPVYKIMIKTDNNGKASTTANDIILYTATYNTETREDEFEELPDNKLYTYEGVKIDGIPNVSLEDGNYYAASFLMLTRIRELGEKQTDGSFKFPERYVKTGDQYASGFVDTEHHYTFVNNLIRGTAKLHKTNDNDENLPNSIWTLKKQDENNSDIYNIVELTNTKNTETQEIEQYSYSKIADTNDIKTTITTENGTEEMYINERILVTNSVGDIKIDNLPPGKYKLTEVEPPEGYMPLGKDLIFEITPENYQQELVVDYDVTDGANIMPNTGGTGPVAAVATAILFAIPTAILAIMYNRRKKNRKIR